MKKRILSVLLAFCLILGMIPLEAKAETAEGENKNWSDDLAGSFESGAGTKDDPYLIATPEQLAKLAVEVNAGVPNQNHEKEYFELKNDIDLSGKTWTPIGYGNESSKPFTGYFNGKGHRITGLYVDERGKNCSAGLFGVVVATTNETVLQNIIIKDAKVYAGDETKESHVSYGAGVLVGSVTVSGGSAANYIAIKNCEGYGLVDSKMYAGGLIGQTNYGVISDCVADVNVTGTTCSGGFTGFSFKSQLSNNKAKGSVICNGYCGGGFAGYSNTSTFINNEAAASVVDTGWSAGGFAGADLGSTFEKCIASGGVEADDWNVGGFIGYLENGTNIRNSVALGDVTGKLKVNKPKAGGFVGTNNTGNIKNCYAAGTVTGSNEYASAGGFVGYDISGTTESCQYDKTKNPTLNAVGDTETEGSNDVIAKETREIIADICENYYGGHEYATEWTVDKEATCTEEGSQSHHCKRCDNQIDVTVVEKKGHILEKTEAKNATYLAEGNIAYWTCRTCQKHFKDEAGTQEITLADTVIAKLTTDTVQNTVQNTVQHTVHTPDATGWHTDENNHWKTCECGEIINKAAHTEKTVTTEAGFDKAGTSVTSCSVCGKELSTAVIPMVSDVTLSKNSYTYNRKVKTPSVTVKDSKGTVLQNGKDYEVTYAGSRKSIGRYTVRITLKGKYTGTKELTFEITPKGTKLTAKSGQKEAFTVKWKKQKEQINGYQIQYATKQNFSNAKTVTIEKKTTTKKNITDCAAKKTYYVRIRTYKNVKVNGKTDKITSSWSQTVKVKTK